MQIEGAKRVGLKELPTVANGRWLWLYAGSSPDRCHFALVTQR